MPRTGSRSGSGASRSPSIPGGRHRSSRFVFASAWAKLERQRNAFEVEVLSNRVFQKPLVVRLHEFGIVTVEYEYRRMRGRLRRVVDAKEPPGRSGRRMRQGGVANQRVELRRRNAAVEVFRDRRHHRHQAAEAALRLGRQKRDWRKGRERNQLANDRGQLGLTGIAALLSG